MIKKLRACIIAGAMVVAFPAWSHDSSKMDTPETRQEMAQMHEEMAKCLRSDRELQECHDEMMQNCPMMKDGKCPMHGMMGMGMDHEKMMKGKQPSKTK